MARSVKEYLLKTQERRGILIQKISARLNTFCVADARACAKRAYTGAMRAARKIRYHLEWLGLKSEEVNR
jgi:hypothetical protein